MKNEKGEITMDTAEIQKKKKKSKYCEQFYGNKFDSLEEMDNFLETYSLLKLNQEEIDQLNRPITRNEIQNSLQINIQDQMASQVNSNPYIFF